MGERIRCLCPDKKRLFSRQPFPIPKSLYTRLPCIQYKSVIYTAATSHTKSDIYTVAVHKVKERYLTTKKDLNSLHKSDNQVDTYGLHVCIDIRT